MANYNPRKSEHEEQANKRLERYEDLRKCYKCGLRPRFNKHELCLRCIEENKRRH